MGSVPADQRGVAAGMRGTFFNSGSALSIGVFFSLMIVGLASTLPRTLTSGLVAQGVPGNVAQQVGNLPPVGSLFAAFLGFNPLASLLGPSGVLNQLPEANADNLTGKQFFPHLISGPFHHGLIVVFVAAAIMMVIGAVASLIQTKPLAVAPSGPDAGATVPSASGAASVNGTAPIDAVDAESADVVAAETIAADKAR
jgi:hypothetical protein